MRLPDLPDTRTEFFLPRAAVSLLLLAAFWVVVRFCWYPGHHFELAGTARLILIAAGFVLLAGPVLTAMLYKRDKKGMYGDIGVLLVVELVAIGIAATAIYDRRPAYLVFTIDRFEIVSPAEVDTDLIGFPELKERGLETLVAARLPQDPALAGPIVEDIVFNGGRDIDRRPSLWEPYEYSAREAASRASPLSALDQRDTEQALQRWLETQNEPAFKFGFLPVRGLKGDASLIVNEQGFPVAILPIDPWLD